jgi:hypothetical protein
MPRPKTYPRREVNGSPFYVIASPNIFDHLALISDSIGADPRMLYVMYSRVLPAMTKLLSTDIGLPVTTEPTSVGHDWLIPANDFNATRYVWAERKATKYFKLLIKQIKQETEAL